MIALPPSRIEWVWNGAEGHPLCGVIIAPLDNPPPFLRMRVVWMRMDHLRPCPLARVLTDGGRGCCFSRMPEVHRINLIN